MSDQNPSQVAVIQSVRALLNSYSKSKLLTDITAKVEDVIQDEEEDFLLRISKLDQIMESNPEFEPLAELLFDLLMVHFLAAEEHMEDYFDSPEWNEIENKTLDRGSEMLNLFLYISEANETNVEISLDDFLNEFLLVGEDEFQEEYRIYESLIVNEELLDADLSEMKKVQSGIKADTGLQEYFIPLVLFFQLAEEVLTKTNLPEGLSAFETATLESMLAFSSAGIIDDKS
ncbi:MAG: hypothetical protein H7296_06995 [Bacteroidia bacterium]|nr:hypothetical protein [Bacteroidia bacterium]